MKDLADTISDIPQKTQDVIDTANESHIVETQRAMGVSLEGTPLTCACLVCIYIYIYNG
jgi:hypothetical protein